jgi:hypothetical protein
LFLRFELFQGSRLGGELLQLFSFGKCTLSFNTVDLPF